MSFIQIMNKRGPKVDPCGTPVKIFVKADLILFISRLCFQFLSTFRLNLMNNLEYRKI